MSLWNLLIIPVFMSFTDCDKPREPAQPVSAFHKKARTLAETSFKDPRKFENTVGE